jgi:tetratricopeptide (TPR) repeat protein
LIKKHLFGDAITEFQKALALERNPKYVAWLGHAYAAAGKREAARKILAELMVQSKRRYIPAYDVALLYTGLGDNEQALVWLKRAYEEHSRGLCWIKVEPRLDPLRADPRFSQILKQMGLAATIATR